MIGQFINVKFKFMNSLLKCLQNRCSSANGVYVCKKMQISTETEYSAVSYHYVDLYENLTFGSCQTFSLS